jgi:hypothetical protein
MFDTIIELHAIYGWKKLNGFFFGKQKRILYVIKDYLIHDV